MESIFGRKRKPRQNGEIITSSGTGGYSSAEVVGNSLTSRYNISAPNGNPSLGAYSHVSLVTRSDPGLCD